MDVFPDRDAFLEYCQLVGDKGVADRSWCEVTGVYTQAGTIIHRHDAHRSAFGRAAGGGGPQLIQAFNDVPLGKLIAKWVQMTGLPAGYKRSESKAWLQGVFSESDIPPAEEVCSGVWELAHCHDPAGQGRTTRVFLPESPSLGRDQGNLRIGNCAVVEAESRQLREHLCRDGYRVLVARLCAAQLLWVLSQLVDLALVVRPNLGAQ